MIRSDAQRLIVAAATLEMRDVLHRFQPRLVVKRVEVSTVSAASQHNCAAKAERSKKPQHRNILRTTKQRAAFSLAGRKAVKIY
jgi:hypothetical protein